MSCTPTPSAFTRGCNSVSGIAELYLIEKTAREATDITFTTTNGATVIAGTAGVGAAYLWKPLQNGFNFTQPITQDNTAGTSSIIQTIDGVLHGYTSATVYLGQELRKGRWEVAMKMRNGVYVYAGLDEVGLQMGGGDNGASGQAINDPNGLTVNLVCECEDAAPTFTFSEFDAAFTITEA